MTTFSSNFSNLLVPGLRKILYDRYNQNPWEYDKIFNIEKSTRAYEEDYGMADFGNFVETGQGEAITYDDPISGNTKRYTHVKYALGFRVTEEAVEDDQYRMIRKLPRALGKSARHCVEQNAANLFNYGFVTTYNTTADGKALFATDHTRLDGGTAIGNEPSVAADLSETSLKEAIIAMENTVNDRGILTPITAKKLVVPVGLRFLAKELLKSSGKVDTANNNINPLQDEGLKIFVWHYLTDPDAWFLLGDDHELNFFWRKKLKDEHERDFDTGDLKYKAVQRFSYGATDWRATYGSPGA